MQCVAITGATGLIGRALIEALLAQRYRVLALTRDPHSVQFPAGVEARRFDPMGDVTPLPFEGADAIVHLAGETVAGRWNNEKKKRIYNSRVIGTRTVVNSLAQLQLKPRTMVCASAVGYYGARGDEHLSEISEAGDDFLANVCVDWEREAQRAAALGIRTVQLRTGIVLSRRSGALGKMLPAFRLGLGGPLGSGSQFMPWIHIDDLVAMYCFSMDNTLVDGILNAVAPNAITNSRFAKALGHALHRPSFFSAPAFALRAVLGEFAESLLGSQLVIPKRPVELGFTWQFGEIDLALSELLR